MSISPVTAPAPVTTPAAATPPRTDPNNDGDTDAGASQPTVLAALPPGQGTRIDQIA
jgi:hypothetical protein